MNITEAVCHQKRKGTADAYVDYAIMYAFLHVNSPLDKIVPCASLYFCPASQEKISPAHEKRTFEGSTQRGDQLNPYLLLQASLPSSSTLRVCPGSFSLLEPSKS